jgi:cell pole-organizing protein PopZ
MSGATPSPQTPPTAGGSAPPGGADPSMEDILASIRRILSDDEQPAAGAPAVVPAQQPAGHIEAPPAEAAEVLALSEAMLVPPPVPAAVAEPAPAVVVPPASATPASGPVRGPDRLVTPEAEAAAASSVSALVRTLVQEREQVGVYRGGPTIEDVVREELRPLLKAWLDSNLPPLVERLVRTEIERVMGRVVP